MKKASTVCIALVLLMALSGCGGRNAVEDVKGVMFDSINAAATLGEMVDVVICNAKWSSEKISDDLYRVTVTGTIQDDIPDFRSNSHENFCAVLSVQYYNDQYQVSVTDGYFGSANTYDSVTYLSAAYKVAAGITPENLLMDVNKETSNEALPLFTIQQERRADRAYRFSRESATEVYDSCSGTYYWMTEIGDAPNRVGYTLNGISLELYGAGFLSLDDETKDIVLELFNSGTKRLEVPQVMPNNGDNAEAGEDRYAFREVTLSEVLADEQIAEYMVNGVNNTINGLSRGWYDVDFFCLPEFAQELILLCFNSQASDESFLWYEKNEAGYSLDDISAYAENQFGIDSEADYWIIVRFYLNNDKDLDALGGIAGAY